MHIFESYKVLFKYLFEVDKRFFTGRYYVLQVIECFQDLLYLAS